MGYGSAPGNGCLDVPRARSRLRATRPRPGVSSEGRILDAFADLWRGDSATGLRPERSSGSAADVVDPPPDGRLVLEPHVEGAEPVERPGRPELDRPVEIGVGDAPRPRRAPPAELVERVGDGLELGADDLLGPS